MDAGLLSTIALALAAPPVALGLVGASSRLAPIARVIDVRRPAVIAWAIGWAVIVPYTLAALAGPHVLIPAALFAWGGLALALADLAALRAPHVLSLAFGAIGVSLAASGGPAEALTAAITALCCFAFMQAARVGFRKARGYEGMGGGDPGVMAALGAWSGPLAAPWVLACACTLGLAAVLAIPGLRRPRARLAFAPWLVAGGAIVAIVRAAFTSTPFWTMGGAP